MLKRQCKHDKRRVTRQGDPRLVAHWLAPPGAGHCGLAQDDSRGERLFPPRHLWRFSKGSIRRRLPALFAVALLSGSALAAPPGAVIANQASLDYTNSGGLAITVPSNVVELTTAVVRSPASVEFTRVVAPGTGAYQEPVGPSACLQGGSYVTLADPTLIGGATIDPTSSQDVSATSVYNRGEAAFIRLTDSDQNLDFQVIDYAVVTVTNPQTGDAETVRLAETGLDTGIFAGYIPVGQIDGH